MRELASVALEASQVESEEEGAGIGPVHPTPIMKWLAEREGPVDGFNQTVVLRVPPDLGLEPLTAAVQAVLDRHDTLRLAWHGIEGVRPVGGESAGGLEVLPVGAVRAAECVRRVEIADVLATATAGPEARTGHEAMIGHEATAEHEATAWQVEGAESESGEGPRDVWAALVAEQAARSRAGLDPAGGRMVQVAWLDAGPRVSGRLVVT
ncbi:hypothetical protein, partial [Planobispora longispora]|uniref:hypothetical protein n=1 Tax=Planobispora longispora TaxID=28887 RepID=UPI0035E533F6